RPGVGQNRRSRRRPHPPPTARRSPAPHLPALPHGDDGTAPATLRGVRFRLRRRGGRPGRRVSGRTGRRAWPAGGRRRPRGRLMTAPAPRWRSPRMALADWRTRLRATHPTAVLRWLRAGVLAMVATTALLYLVLSTEADHQIAAARRTERAIR